MKTKTTISPHSCQDGYYKKKKERKEKKKKKTKDVLAKMWRKKEHLYTVGMSVNWYSHYRKWWRFLKKLKIELT